MIFTEFCKETERLLKYCYISPVFDSQTKPLLNTYCRLSLCCNVTEVDQALLILAWVSGLPKGLGERTF